MRGTTVRGFLGKPPPKAGAHTRTSIPDDERGIWYEIGRMVEFVQHYSGEPLFIDAARRIVENCPPRDQMCEVRTLYEWVLASTRFVQDPYDKEALSTPERMLRENLAGRKTSEDCDGLSTYLATLIAAIGVRPRFRFGGSYEQGIHHVWVQAEINGRWIDMDPSIGSRLGKHHPFQIYEMEEIFE